MIGCGGGSYVPAFIQQLKCLFWVTQREEISAAPDKQVGGCDRLVYYIMVDLVLQGQLLRMEIMVITDH